MKISKFSFNKTSFSLVAFRTERVIEERPELGGFNTLFKCEQCVCSQQNKLQWIKTGFIGDTSLVA